MSVLLETKGLKKYFSTRRGNLHAVDNINLSIKAGSTLGVVGESGCGKSTLGRTVLKLHEPTGGEIFYKGVNITKFSPQEMLEYRKKMQIIFQDPYASLNPRMSVGDLIAEPIKVNKTIAEKDDIYQRVFELMDTVGLSSRFINTYPHEMDGGRRQRVGVARALALEPEFIVCDEPVSALDVSIQAQILNLLMDLQEHLQLTYMFITHDLSVVKHISDEIMVMYMGECVERAPSEMLFSNPLHPYTKALLAAIPIPDISLRGKPNKILKGEVSSPINLDDSCRFKPRCEEARENCDHTNYPLVEVEPGHFVACCKYQ